MNSETTYFKSKVRKITVDNKKLIEEYLNRVAKRSHKSATTQKSIIEKCIEYIDKPIHLINKQDILDYIREKIEDNDNLSLSTKETYLRLIIINNRKIPENRLISFALDKGRQKYASFFQVNNDRVMTKFDFKT